MFNWKYLRLGKVSRIFLSQKFHNSTMLCEVIHFTNEIIWTIKKLLVVLRGKKKIDLCIFPFLYLIKFLEEGQDGIDYQKIVVMSRTEAMIQFAYCISKEWWLIDWAQLCFITINLKLQITLALQWLCQAQSELTESWDCDSERTYDKFTPVQFRIEFYRIFLRQ